MNREIKFRFICEDASGEQFIIYRTLEELVSVGLKDGRIQKIISEDQFTGLKDKNGKEIYEGDILKLKLDNKKTDIGHVWYMAPMWKIKKVKEGGSYDLVDWGYGVELDEVEIIGNIHQNKELLK